MGSYIASKTLRSVRAPPTPKPAEIGYSTFLDKVHIHVCVHMCWYCTHVCVHMCWYCIQAFSLLIWFVCVGTHTRWHTHTPQKLPKSATPPLWTRYTYLYLYTCNRYTCICAMMCYIHLNRRYSIFLDQMHLRVCARMHLWCTYVYVHTCNVYICISTVYMWIGSTLFIFVYMHSLPKTCRNRLLRIRGHLLVSVYLCHVHVSVLCCAMCMWHVYMYLCYIGLYSCGYIHVNRRCSTFLDQMHFRICAHT